jgi:hypothetical protein
MDNFLKKLYDTNQELSLLLLEAREIAIKNNEQELLSYIENEINGYNIEGIPDYRKIKAQIVADIKDVYGNLQQKEYPVDFSILSEEMGIELDDAYIPDSISFVEASLKNVTGKNGLKPIPRQLVKMLDETFHHNNKLLHLTAAYHKMPRASLEYVLTKVRQNLIQEFQKINRKAPKKEDEIKITEVESESKKKKVFVTYAWENEEFNSKILSFVEFLRGKGFDASMDKKKDQEESSINFNQMMIDGIQNSDKVLIVLSNKYKERADKFTGGVWTEFKIILEDMKKNKNKYIFLYFGGVKRDEITPTAILGTSILDLKEDQDKNDFNTLFSKIKEDNIILFSDVNEKEVEVVKTKIKPFKL